MDTYYIRDGNRYVQWFSNNIVFFTDTRSEALPFGRLEEAEIVARVLGRLASNRMQVIGDIRSR